MTREKTRQIPPTMRAFAIDRFDDPGSLRELPTPKIGADEILSECAPLALILSTRGSAAG
jgi:hypothetical protein